MYWTDFITLSLLWGFLWLYAVDADCPYKGPLISSPNNNVAGGIPVEWWGTSLYVNKAAGKNESQDSGFSCASFRKIECDCDANNIYCGAKDLTSIPSTFTPGLGDFQYLYLDSNQITTIPAGRLPPKLEQISLSNNPIETVDDTAFDGSADTLSYIAFSQARFKRFPDAFLHLHSLQSLAIFETDINDWNVDAIKHIGQTLVSFHLTQFSLETWPDWVQYLPHLTAFSIVSSSISVIPDNALDAMANSLVYLNFDNNSLTVVPKAVSNLTVLESLSLQENKIVDIGWLTQSDRLRSLILNNNNIADAGHLSNALRRFADTLNDITIDHNQLSAVPDLSFLTQVGKLDFTHNQIKDPSSGSLPVGVSNINFGYNLLPSIPSVVLNLTSEADLMLNSNVIKELRGTDIPTWTKVLGLDHNLISKITDSSFPQNSSLTLLNLNYNPVVNISVSAFRNVPHLKELFIRGTQLTRVPLALVSLTQLNYIDINDSTNLACTCEEKSLGPWFQTFYTDVSGTCGPTTVHDFFVNLSPSCPTRRGLL